MGAWIKKEVKPKKWGIVAKMWNVSEVRLSWMALWACWKTPLNFWAFCFELRNRIWFSQLETSETTKQAKGKWITKSPYSGSAKVLLSLISFPATGRCREHWWRGRRGWSIPAQLFLIPSETFWQGNVTRKKIDQSKRALGSLSGVHWLHVSKFYECHISLQGVKGFKTNQSTIAVQIQPSERKVQTTCFKWIIYTYFCCLFVARSRDTSVHTRLIRRKNIVDWLCRDTLHHAWTGHSCPGSLRPW